MAENRPDEVRAELQTMKVSIAALKGLVKKRMDEQKAQAPTVGEWVRAALAVFVVFFILSIFGIVWFVLGIQDLERAASILLPLVTLILGYYFGSKGSQAAEARADEIRIEAEKGRRKTERREEIAALQSQLKDAQAALASTKKARAQLQQTP